MLKTLKKIRKKIIRKKIIKTRNSPIIINCLIRFLEASFKIIINTL